MPKPLKDILKGVKSSKIVPGSTGSDPGVDYAPKAPNEQEFVKKHKIEKHEDRVGNDDELYNASNIKHSISGEKNHGYKKPEDKNVNENIMAETRTDFSVHEMADCSKTKTLREIAKNPYAIGMAAAMKKTGDKPPLKKSTIVKGHEIAKAVAKEEVEQVDEAGPFSYGKKTPRKGSEAYYAALARKKDFIENPPIEPKDQKVGNAKITKEEVKQVDETANTPSREKMIKDLQAIGHTAEWDLLSTSKLHNHWQKKTKDRWSDDEWKKDSEAAKTTTNQKHLDKLINKWGARGPAFYGHIERIRKLNKEEADVGDKFAQGSYSTSRGKIVKTKSGDFIATNQAGSTKAFDNEKSAKKHSMTGIKEDLAVPLLGGDSDESAEMAKTQLRALANKALHLAMQLNDDQIVEPWVQSKIAVAKDYVTAVHDYMVYGDHEEKEQTAPYDGSIGMSGAPRNTMPSFSVDVNTGRVV